MSISLLAAHMLQDGDLLSQLRDFGFERFVSALELLETLFGACHY